MGQGDYVSSGTFCNPAVLRFHLNDVIICDVVTLLNLSLLQKNRNPTVMSSLKFYYGIFQAI